MMNSQRLSLAILVVICLFMTGAAVLWISPIILQRDIHLGRLHGQSTYIEFWLSASDKTIVVQNGIIYFPVDEAPVYTNNYSSKVISNLFNENHLVASKPGNPKFVFFENWTYRIKAFFIFATSFLLLIVTLILSPYRRLFMARLIAIQTHEHRGFDIKLK